MTIAIMIKLMIITKIMIKIIAQFTAIFDTDGNLV